MDERLRWLAEVAAGQHSALTAAQLRDSGMPKRPRQQHVSDGILERVGTHVLRSPFVAGGGAADLAAFVLDCGPGAVASGPSGAALHRLDEFLLLPPFHAMIPRGRNVERCGHHVHTTQDLEPIDRTKVDGIPVLAVPRCLLDLSRFVSPRRLAAAYDSAIRDRRTTEDAVHERIVALRSKGRYGVPKLIAVIEGGEVTRGGHSWLERRFLTLCADAGLPRPTTQRVVTASKGRLVRVDFGFPGTPVVVGGVSLASGRSGADVARRRAHQRARVGHLSCLRHTGPPVVPVSQT